MAARIIHGVKQLVLDLLPAPLPTFENFVVGRNAEAKNALFDAAFQAYALKVVYLWGVSGSGKTHLARAFASARHVQPSDAAALAMFSGNTADIADGGCYVVDGIDGNDDKAQIGLFNLINGLNASFGGMVLVTGSVAPRDLALRPELTSRLGNGLTFQLHTLSDEEKSAALHAHASVRGFRLPAEVTSYLLKHSRRDMASLMSMLDALDQYSIEVGREITLPMLRTLMAEQK